MNQIIQTNFLDFKEVKNRYTPIINGIVNDFIELEYETNSIYTISWINRYEKCITDRIHRNGLENFILMIHNKYFDFLTNKI